jgi:hypothetical protein
MGSFMIGLSLLPSPPGKVTLWSRSSSMHLCQACRCPLRVLPSAKIVGIDARRLFARSAKFPIQKTALKTLRISFAHIRCESQARNRPTKGALRDGR